MSCHWKWFWNHQYNSIRNGKFYRSLHSCLQLIVQTVTDDLLKWTIEWKRGKKSSMKIKELNQKTTFDCFEYINLRKLLKEGDVCWIKTNVYLYLRTSMDRSSRPEVFCKKGVLRNLTKFTGKHLCRVSFLIKFQALGTDVFMWILSNFSEHLFTHKTSGGCFCMNALIIQVLITGPENKNYYILTSTYKLT